MSTEETLVGKTALITGASAGIGKELARLIHAKGANVIVSGRDQSRCEAAVKEIRAASEGHGSIESITMDLADFDSVRAAASKLEDRQINLLFLNAGMLYTSDYKGPWLTTDGYDHLMAANFLGHFLLCHLLLPCLKRCKASRIIITSSIVHWIGPIDFLFRRHRSLESSGLVGRFRMYGASKLANILHAYELQRRLRAEGSDVVVAPVTPGFVHTQLLSADRAAPPSAGGVLAVPPARGAETALHAALAAPAPPPGAWCLPYLAPVRVGWLRALPWLAEMLQRLTWGPRFAPTAPETYDAGLARDVWAFAEQAVGLAR